MISFLETDEARAEAIALDGAIKENSSISFPPDREGFPLSLLREGMMVAVLVAETKGGERKTIRAFSGAARGIYRIPGWANPCFSVTEFNGLFGPYDRKIHALTDEIEKNGGDSAKEEERRLLSKEAQERINTIFTFSTYDGTLFHGLPGRPRTGSGECAGLKAINTALRKGWEIKGLAEYMYSPHHGPDRWYPPCQGRCEPILEHMLGLRFIYADSHVAVVDKKPGMLSVPGRGEEKRDSVSWRFHTLFPSSPEICHVHRLDMDTSGLLVLAFTKEDVRALMSQFEKREVKKTYVALVEGVVKEEGGTVDLPMRLDVENRPRQIVDHENGKRAVTRWERISVRTTPDARFTLLRFYPETGRTHQLRVHAASGLGHPIAGDNLYGNEKSAERLMLHAESITFRHPSTGEEMTFTSPSPF